MRVNDTVVRKPTKLRGAWGGWAAVPLVLCGVLGLQWHVAARQGEPAASLRGSSASTDRMPPLVEDVEEAFSRIEVRGEGLAASVEGLIPEPWYQASLRNWFGFRNHFQGIQRIQDTDYLVMSGSNIHAPMGSLFIIRMNEDAASVVARIPIDPVMWHTGGLGMDGQILAVPIHGGSPLGSKVVFYDMANPVEPARLPVEIDRPGEKAYAVAFTRLPNDYYLAAVFADRDGLPRRLDFYLSRSTHLSDGFDPEAVRWFASEVEARNGQDSNFADFQSVNFIRQADGRLYLVGFLNTMPSMPFIPGKDYADLYEVVVPDEMARSESPRLARPALVKTANSRMYCKDGYCNMDAAAGIYVDPATRSLEVYAAPAWINGDRLKFTVYRNR
jgi:hypothetical protein